MDWPILSRKTWSWIIFLLIFFLGAQTSVHVAISMIITRRYFCCILGENYLMTTLRSLMENLSPEDRSELLIVVLIGDEEAPSRILRNQILSLRVEFGGTIEEGLLEVIVPPQHFYPADLDSLPSTLGDTPERMKWRTKQTLDYAYLMMYCQNRSKYYIQLEDDVIVTKSTYFSLIKDFALESSGAPWFLLEFCSMGFIGKLFRSSDLPQIVQFFLMFHREKPVDWLLEDIVNIKCGSHEKTVKERNAHKKKCVQRYEPSLFRHVGMYSSLKGKVQMRRERMFKRKHHVDHGLKFFDGNHAPFLIAVIVVMAIVIVNFAVCLLQ